MLAHDWVPVAAPPAIMRQWQGLLNVRWRQELVLDPAQRAVKRGSPQRPKQRPAVDAHACGKTPTRTSSGMCRVRRELMQSSHSL